MRRVGGAVAAHFLVLLSPASCLSVVQQQSAGASDGPVQSVDVGVCITGLARSFGYGSVRENVRKNFLTPFLKGLSYRSFFVLGVVDDPRLHTAIPGSTHISSMDSSQMRFALEDWKGECAIVEDGEKVTGHWGNFGAPQTLQSMKFYPKGHDVRSFSGGGCHGRNKDLSRWGSMQTRLHNCFQLVKEYESARSTSFDKIMFTRPDLLFVGAVPSLADFKLGRKDVFIPEGVVLQQYNDHMFVCGSERCDSYFDVLRKLESGKNMSLKTGLCHSDALDSLMHAAFSQFHVQRKPLPYTLMRPCPVGAECIRLFQKKMYGQACQQMSDRICAAENQTR